VTAESLEECVNELCAAGWSLEGIRFVMAEGSRRPTMAFVSGTRRVAAEVADGEAPRTPPPLVRDPEDDPGL
jgi:hypothetical protein